MSKKQPRGLQVRARLAIGVLLALAVLLPSPDRGRAVADEASVLASPHFPEVGRIDVDTSGDFGSVFTGWMILDPANRRGYTLSEGANSTSIQSFDLDTLKPRKRAVIPGIPVPSGYAGPSPKFAYLSGDVIHAVDPVANRIYLPMTGIPNLNTGVPGPDSDQKRVVHYVLVLDGGQFDIDPSRAFGAFSFPAAQQRLQAYPLMGLTVSRHHVTPLAGKPPAGKLLALFASPNQLGVAPVLQQPLPGPYDHTLTQWDPSSVSIGGRVPPNDGVTRPLPLETPPDWEQVLFGCATAPMSSPDTQAARNTNTKNFEWEFLPARDAVYLACQSAPSSGAVARVALDPSNGRPVPGAGQQVVSLGKPISDVLVDSKGMRLYLRSFGGGATWWAFDATDMRFAGSIAAHYTDTMPMAAGMDQGSGRLYTLTPDTCASSVPNRGGIKMTEARLDPVPAPQNLRPDMAYNSWWGIHVDSVKRRVFVRRGAGLASTQLTYPECDANKRVDAPVEPFYRVFEDRIPVAEQPGELDDSQFTTNVREEPGITQASFVGSGTGFGSRLVLTGGLDALGNGAPSLAESMCGRDDRELLAGSVGGVEVSDQATRAEAASLDADAGTREAFGDPASRCRPQAPSPAGNELNKCHGDTEELAFDEKERDDEKREVDANKDGCPDRDGKNRYAASCIQDKEEKATAPKKDQSTGPQRIAPRHGFVATVKCDTAKEQANADAEGGLGAAAVDTFHDTVGQATLPGGPLRVGRSSSDVSVSRKMGEGITVKVDSLARGIEIPGLGTIGAVRAEATSTARGRERRAFGRYERTICDVRINRVVVSGCLGDEKQQAALIKQLNEAAAGRAEFRLRHPDGRLLRGTEHGYVAAVQRDQKELFGDRDITRDKSLAVPGLEIILFIGEGGAWGAGRQVLQLAGVQAATSYGIACVFGQRDDGSCARGDELPPAVVTGGDGETLTVTETQHVDRRVNVPVKGGSRILRFVKKIPQAIAQAISLLFNNPRELALLAAVWGLLYAPCYLGDRRRSIASLAARRAAGGV